MHALATANVASAKPVLMAIRRRDDSAEILFAYVRMRLVAECRERGAAARIAKATGISSAHITNVQKGERGIGYPFARALALYWGTTIGALEEEAHAWARENPAAARATAADPYPNRTEAAQLAREHGVPETAIAAVLAEGVAEEDAARSVLWWSDRMRYEQLRQLEPTAPVPATTPPQGIPRVRRVKG